MNGFTKTAILMAGMTGLFTGVGSLIGGQQGAVIALGLAAATNAFAYWGSDTMVLRYYGAREITEQTDPGLVGMVKTLARNAQLPMPKVYIIENEQPNAFATGRSPSHAAVAVSTGLLKTLGMPEIAGVLAHELAHIKNRDTLTMTVTATLAGAISMLANMAMFFSPRSSEDGQRQNPQVGLLVMVLAPLAAVLVQMAISRAREYEADKMGAQISGKPEWLAEALEKIAGKAMVTHNPQAEHNPATAHMFIINPLHVRGIEGLFATHPATEERVRRLRAMAQNDK